MMARWVSVRLFTMFLVAGALVACGGGSRSSSRNTPSPETAQGASAEEVDALWKSAMDKVHRGKWGEALKQLDRALLEFGPGDPRTGQAHFYLGEAHFAVGEHLEGVREFRHVSDDTPNDPLAPEALLRAGDVYADLWRRPELDPSYGQTSLATYQELLNRYPNTGAAKRAQERIAELQERFAYKEYRAALYYYRLKAYDSAILYLKDLVATYPRAAIAPEALMKLVQAYEKLGYSEDVQETCGYLRRFHPNAPGSSTVCPPDTTEAS